MGKIVITDGNIILYAQLNNSLSSKNFERHLPYALSGEKEINCYRFLAAKGRYDPMEYRTKLKKGDITLDHGFFSICIEDDFFTTPSIVIGRLETESIFQLENLPKTMNIYICSA